MLFTPPLIDPSNGGAYYIHMKKKKNNSTDPPIEYIPVMNKQIRWILCRKYAEVLYHSNLTDEQIRDLSKSSDFNKIY